VNEYQIIGYFTVPVAVTITASTEEEALRAGQKELKQGSGTEFWESGQWSDSFKAFKSNDYEIS
jgi:hypothetical protein